MTRLFLGIDPGPTTGLALYDLGVCKFVRKSALENRYVIRDWIEKLDLEAVVCEDWVTFLGNELIGDTMLTTRIIGSIEDNCQRLEVPLHLISSSKASWWSNHKLRKTGYYTHHDSRHIKSAQRVVLTHLTELGLIPDILGLLVDG